MHLPQTAMFKKGDLIKFNTLGEELFIFLEGQVGVISSSPIIMFEYEFEDAVEYIVYDLIVAGQLFKHIPEEFLDRITQSNKEDIE
jgi:hypothetical protein|tara:strand:- start:3488 stop:3745 length:258 start_codon:yes stop_codon:yes gene_type:complete